MRDKKYFSRIIYIFPYLALFFFLISPGYSLEFIIDNNDTTVCFVSSTTGWMTSTWGNPYGPDKFYTTKGTGEKTVTWISRLPFGRFNIRAWVNSAPYAGDAHYIIIHSRGTTAITRSQNLVTGEWPIDLGTYDFDTVGIIQLSDYWTGPQAYVVADAIKFMEVSTTQVSWATYSPFDAITIATAQNKPILIYFSTDKSTDCQRMTAESFQDPTLAKWSERFVTVHIEAENNPEPLRLYRVYRVPTIIFMDQYGNEKRRIEGFKTSNELTQELNSFLSTIPQ